MNATNRPLQGFWPFFSKELSEWWKRRAALATVAVVGALGTIGTLDTRIEQWAGDLVPDATALNPTMNILGAQFNQWVAFAAIFATIGILTQERATGTLTWTLSKPMSRNALLLAKWAGAVVMLTAFAILLPLALSTAVATLSYGALPDLVVVAKLAALLVAVPAFFAALNLALATRLSSQAAIAAIAIGTMAVPLLFGGLLPILSEIWPTEMGTVAITMASGETANLTTITSWAVCVLAVGIGGLVIFSREDL